MVQNLGDKRIGFPKVRNDSSFMETQREPILMTAGVRF